MNRLYQFFCESAIRTLVFSIFTNAFKESDKFSKIFVNGEKIDRIFSAFQLKFYFNDTIQMTKEKKLLSQFQEVALKVNTR